MSQLEQEPPLKLEGDGVHVPLRPEAAGGNSWKVLIVDDEVEVHDATVFALSNLTVQGCPMAFLHAYNEPDAQMLLAQNPDIAVVLLDVVMEAGDSGLRLVKYLRDDLQLTSVRIVLRTGQPGYAPELEVIQHYDINDYKTKLELTRTRLATTIIAAIRSFEQIRVVNDLNATLEFRVKERTTELLRVNQELESFSYAVAHDLRGPLRHLIGFASLLEEGLGASLNAENRMHMDRISQAAVRMGQLINDLLKFSHVGRASLRKVHIDINQLVSEVLHELQTQIQNRSIVWRIADLPAVVADASLLKQVLINLLSNAIKYTGMTAEAKIEIGVLQREKSETVTVFYVRDNGVGFDMKDAEKLFQPFSRLHSQADFEGNGIGLSIVNSIIQRHGGRVWVDAQVGAGATAYFSLPG